MLLAENHDCWVRSPRFACSIYHYLEERISGDPTPWEEWPKGDDAPQEAKSSRLAKRTTLALQRTFRQGRLIGYFFDNRSFRPIPPTAFALFRIAHQAFTLGGLEIDPLWSDEWQTFNGAGFFVRSTQLRASLLSGDLLRQGNLPALSLPTYSRDIPERVTDRQPSELSYVPLSEALSFMAFGLALKAERLSRALDWNSLLNGDRERAIDLLTQAVAALCDLASIDPKIIRMRGKRVASSAGNSAKVTLKCDLDPIVFANFARFDAQHDGLALGSGTSYRPTSLSDLLEQPQYAYHEVVVNRDDLMKHFLARSISSSLVAGKPSLPSHQDIVAWCSRHISSGKGNGMDAAWEEFKRDPAHKGCSRDHVFRPAWGEAKTRSGSGNRKVARTPGASCRKVG